MEKIFNVIGPIGIVFILVVLICIFILNLKTEYSLLMGVFASIIFYLIKTGKIKK